MNQWTPPSISLLLCLVVALWAGNSLAAQGKEIPAKLIAPGQVCTLDDDYLFEGVLLNPKLDDPGSQGYAVVFHKTRPELPLDPNTTGASGYLVQFTLPESPDISARRIVSTGLNKEGENYTSAYFVTSFQLKKGSPLPKQGVLSTQGKALSQSCIIDLSGVKVTQTYQEPQH